MRALLKKVLIRNEQQQKVESRYINAEHIVYAVKDERQFKTYWIITMINNEKIVIDSADARKLRVY